MFKYTDSNCDSWEFDLTNGCLTHPGGYLTSWFVEKNNEWFVSEWAEYVHPIIVNEIMSQWNNGYSCPV